MNNFNPNGVAGNRSGDHPRSSSVSASMRSRSLFGFHQFSNNEAAHSFVNTALSSGGGYRGGIATAFEIPDPSTLQSPRLNGAGFNGLPGSHNSSVVPSALQGFFSAMNPIGLHPHPMQNRAPHPSDSVMLVLASVDQPSATSGQRLQSQQQNGSQSGGLNGNPAPSPSPFPSNASVASCHSHSSLSSHRSSSNHSSSPGIGCQCDFCRRCVCHMYCNHHAEIRCPVHGLGRSSSAESNASSSPVTNLPGNGSAGSRHPRFPSNVSESSSHSPDSWDLFDSEFDQSPVHSDSCQCVNCQFCICNVGGMFTNCIARCAKHGMVRLY